MSPFQLTRTLAPDAAGADLRTDVLHGLTRSPKELPPKWFYDARGSELFEEITRLPEYYPTRAEREILKERAPEIAAATGARTLVELGSGSSEKTRFLIDALLPGLDSYVPVDVSESALTGAAESLLAERPELRVHALIADFTRGSRCPEHRGRAWWRSSAARSATSCPASGGPSSVRCGRCSPRATPCCWARTW